MSNQADIFPTSYAQQRLWILDQLVPGNPFYNMFSLLPLRVQNVATLERAVNEIVSRHETLRTTFSTIDGQPVQVIAPTLKLTIPVVDLRGLPSTEQLARVQRLTQEEACRPFDLARGPLLRATLVRQEDTEATLLLTIHHIVSDGWSMAVFFRELTTLYQSYMTRRSASLPQLSLQYADFAVWQRNWLKGEVLDQQLNYWRQQLEGVPFLRLPTDRPRPLVKNYRGARLPVKLPGTLVRRLRSISLSEGATLFMTLLAAFQLLLYRYTEQADVAVGSPIAGRNRGEIEDLIGFFVNTLVLRTDLSGDPSFRELLKRVRSVATAAYEHQDLPFEMLVEMLQPERDLGRNPLFQVIFQLLNTPSFFDGASSHEVAAISTAAATHSGTAKFDLEFSLFESPHGLLGHFEYSTELFDESTVARMAVHFETLLESIVASPDTNISQLTFLTAGERELVVSTWNQTCRQYPRDLCVHTLVESQVRRAPDSIAIVDGEEQWTYRALDQRANTLANRLRSLGAGPGSLVAVCMERSAEMIAALLAVLKSGAAYVPLDPEYPKMRIAFMLADTEACVLMTERQFVGRLPEHNAVILLDAEDESSDEECASPAAPTASDLAYVMYTSGSTGRPKGVCIPHRAINRLVLNTNYVTLGPSDRLGHISSPSFDAATFEIWGALLLGGRIVVIPKDVVLSPVEFGEEIRCQGVTAMFLTSALFNQLASDNPRMFQTMRYLLVGGSAVDPNWAHEVLEKGAPDRLLNGYGPTESTTFAACYHIQDVPDGATTIPIGRPIANTQLYILDPHLAPVPVGVPGELYIGGDGLAQGYLRRVSLTEEKFVPHPFADDPEARLYKTGDLVRWRGTGDIEFLGRMDEQVKVRGFRVELGEIEAELGQHPTVQEAVVVARADAHGDKRLVAYVVPRAEPDAATSETDLEQIAQHQVGNWQEIFNGHVYRQFAENDDPTFNITGWISSYTGEPLPEPDMREWLNDTVGHLNALAPHRVLEIGCGTGLLLFRLAANCSAYWGTDFSSTALGYIQQVMTQSGSLLPQVKLLQRTADDFRDIEPGTFDLVILNSVVQYFPNVDYLQRVLEGAVRATRPGGHVFVGDVRSLPLMQVLHMSIEFSNADDSTTTEELRERAQTGMAHETELVVDPKFFTSMPERVPEVSYVEVVPKRGQKRNELTRYRYQVILQVGPALGQLLQPEWIDWREHRWDVGTLRQILQQEQPAVLGLSWVANARLLSEYNVVEMIERDDSPPTVGDLSKLASGEENPAIDPQDLWALEYELPYRVVVSWARHRREGQFDVAFVRITEPPKQATIRFPFDPTTRKDLSHLANNPLRRDVARKLVPQLRAFLQERLPEFMVPSAFVVLGSLSLTPNGKVDRKALPAPDRTHPELEETYVAPVSPTEQIIAGIWCDVLGLDRVGIRDNFFELGGDSILSIQIIARARAVGLQLTAQQIFQHQTIADLATVAGTLISTVAEQGLLVGAVPLTPIQRWFFEQALVEAHHFNQAALLTVSPATDANRMREAVGHILRHHDALRLRFGRSERQWTQYYAEYTDEVPFNEIDLRSLCLSSQTTAIEKECALAQASLDLEEGPVVRVVLFRLGAPNHDRLFIVVHHLAIDGVSWRVLMEDLQTCYQHLNRFEPAQLPAKTTSFKRWAKCLLQYAGSAPALQELSFWLQRPVETFELPVDHQRGDNTFASAHHIEVALTPDETRSLLQEVPTAYRTQVNDALLAALGQSLARWTGNTNLLFDLEGHGREDLFEGVDLSRTIGWFTTIFPVCLTIKPEKRPAEALKSIKEQLRRIPNRGIGYGVLRYLSDDPSVRQRLSDLPQAQLSFNYLGQFNVGANASASNGDTTTESIGFTCGPLDQRHYLLEINGRVECGALRVIWTYSENRHRHETILQVAEDFVAELRKLVLDCRTGKQSEYVPSDFPDVKINQDQLDQLLAIVGDVQVEDIYPLSPMQEVMLFQTLYAPNSGAYMEQVTFPCSGSIHSVTLRQAWEQVAQLYTSLRTSFFWEDLDQPLQMVIDQVELPWVEHDLNMLPVAAREKAIQVYLEEDRRRGFDLSQAPLMRFAWFSLTPNEHWCIWSFHHLVLDGWSLQIVIQKVSEVYRALDLNVPFSPDVVRPFGDYVRWIQRQDSREASAFWRHRLAGIAAPTRFNIDRDSSIPHAPSHLVAAEDTVVPSLTTLHLKELCRQHSLTLNTFLLGVWALALSCYSNETDVLFGTVVSGRPADLSGIESMVGMFINSLPVRVHVDAIADVIPWLQEIQAQQLEMRKYEYSHLGQIQEVSDIPGGTQMFESVVVFENFPIAKFQENVKGQQQVSAVLEQSNLPLTIMVVPTTSQILIRILYSCDRFDAATVKQIAGHLRSALDAIATNPYYTVREVPILTIPERKQLLEDWNDTEQTIALNESLTDLFEDQCARTADAVALQYEGARITYAELNAQSNRLAWHLKMLGVGSEVLVGICMDRSVDFYVALLATFKAGGAYLPLDPKYPKERLEFILKDAGVRLVLTQKRFAPALRTKRRKVFSVDAGAASLRKYPTTNLRSEIFSQQLAYVIYTSGSTGKPKGALGLHSATLNRFAWMWHKYPFAVGEVCCQKTSLGFVDSIWETLGPLLRGVPVVIVPEDEVKDCEQFIELLSANNVSRLVLVPSLLSVMLETGTNLASRLPALRCCVCSGERLPLELVHDFREKLPHVLLLNLYGSSEVAADVTYYEVSKRAHLSSVSIGRPIANTQVYILNADFQPVPIGVPGELFVGGLGLARGYLNRPELTALKFVPDPFSNWPGARLYRTGDIAQFLPDGNVDYIGRVDNQVKIRGYRLELGEIEAVLAEHPAVNQVVVTAHGSTALDKQLVAYIVAGSKPAPSSIELRRFLKSKLPEYMMPAIFISLDSMPLTPSGKVNRQALPRPDDAGQRAERIILAPRNATEQSLTNIWSKILGRNSAQISMDDNFFVDLGGHSLLATQLVSRVRTAFKVELSLRHLFESPSIEALAQEIDGMGVASVAIPTEIQRLSRERSRVSVRD